MNWRWSITVSRPWPKRRKSYESTRKRSRNCKTSRRHYGKNKRRTVSRWMTWFVWKTNFSSCNRSNGRSKSIASGRLKPKSNWSNVKTTCVAWNVTARTRTPRMNICITMWFCKKNTWMNCNDASRTTHNAPWRPRRLRALEKGSVNWIPNSRTNWCVSGTKICSCVPFKPSGPKTRSSIWKKPWTIRNVWPNDTRTNFCDWKRNGDPSRSRSPAVKHK